MEIQIGGIFDQPLHAELISLLVALRSRGSGAGTFACIEHAPLDGSGISIECHGSAKGVDLSDHVSLGEATDGGVAAHLADGVEILRKHGNLTSHARSSKGGLDACVPGPDHENIVFFWINKHVQ